jgi:DNA-binding response OmpR family regulator
MHIALAQKIDEDDGQSLIVTVKGLGYKIVDKPGFD